MRVAKCEKGHFFDSNVYVVCPLCSNSEDSTKSEERYSPVEATVVASAPVGKSDEKKLFSFKNFFGKQLRQDEQQEKNNPIAQSISNENHTNEETGEVLLPTNNAKMYDMPVTVEEKEQRYGEVGSEEKNYSFNPAAETLQDAIQQVSASDDGKTMSFFNATMEKENRPTKNIDPVVGWLVSIEGKHFGESFVIHSGMNSIGRNRDNDIILCNDLGVSREKHAFVVFEPKKREFYVKPGNSSGLTYVNDAYITEVTKVQGFDSLEIGASKFLFIPLCSADFSWEEYINNSQ